MEPGAGDRQRPATFPGLLRRNRDEHGPKAALVTEDRSITHAGLDAESRSLAARLVGAGVGKGDRVGLLLPNGIEWAVTAAAVVRIGGVLVPLSTLLRPPELLAQLQVASVTHLVVARSFRGRSYLDDLSAVAPGAIAATAGGRRDPQLPSLRRVWPVDELPALVDEALVDERLVDEAQVHEGLVDALAATVRPADDLVVLFTSGSRGAPKGTIHTHGGALGAVASGLAARCVGPADRLYIPMPFFWTGGFSGGLLTALVAGATLITEAVPSPERTLELLERERVTLFRGWPDQAARLAAHPRFAEADLSSLGPASLPGVLPPAQRPAPGARANLFGMTETFGPYCGARLDLDLPAEAWGSCGRPFDGVEVRIADPGPDGIGEIRVRGPHVMRGICGRTRDATFDADGFYPTGDLGSLDLAGFLRYHGRLDDMVKVKGATVYPAEVEAAIRSVDGVRQAHVTDVPGDDGATEVGALVVSSVPLPDLVAGVRARLSAFKVPTRWVVTSSPGDVPLTATAKVDKPALQALLLARSANGAPVHGGRNDGDGTC
jgi:acyl-CoA synthetase (AMP-forming)/AMP-acid ligase II